MVGQPAVTLNDLGQGRAIYCAAPIERAMAQGDAWADAGARARDAFARSTEPWRALRAAGPRWSAMLLTWRWLCSRGDAMMC